MLRKEKWFLTFVISIVNLGVLLAQLDIAEQKQKVKKKIKIDGVAAIVGDYAVLDSDIDKRFIELETQGADIKEFDRCDILNQLMENKLLIHQAVQDSVIVSDNDIRKQGELQINRLVDQSFKSEEKLLAFYKVDDMETLKEMLFEINKKNQLAIKMQEKIVNEIEVTPDEVKQYFESIPKDKKPVFGTELEISQIVKRPEIPEAEKQAAIEKLKEIKQDVEDNDASFSVKAILYSKDPTSAPKGGFYKVTRQTSFLKEFKDVAFSLSEGEISEPFETSFGYHIIYLEKIRGQELDLRHILIIPEIPNWALEKTRTEIEKIREKIIANEISFQDAARKFSDEKETKNDGGLLRNPTNLDTRFELTRLDPNIYNQVRKLKENEVSNPIIETDPRTQKPQYKIIQITNKYEEHEADYSKDFTKIKELALKDKKLRIIRKWMSEKIEETYIAINGEYKTCDYKNNWLKK